MAEVKSATSIVRSQISSPTAIKSPKMKVPEVVGILSQSLHPSPSIKLILPARIRCKAQNDVVFVGGNFIQLREFLPSGQLADVTAKVDLGTQILSAKVISSKPQPDSLVDQIIKQELDNDCCNNKGSDQVTFPPQLLVVSTAACNIVFLFAKNRAPGVVEFVSAGRKLLTDASVVERYAAQVAVDQESRAMAVASPDGFCAIFNLKEVHDIAREVDASDPVHPTSFKPFLEERFMSVDGIVKKMDFLPSPPHQKNLVILLLLVAQRGGTYLHLYSWDIRLGLGNAKPNRCSGQRLPFEDSHPVMLIPSTQWTSFIIVTESEIVVYDDILSSHAKRINLPLSDQYPPRYENSTRTPLWVQWTKPSRHEGYNKNHDDICLVREDGQLRYYIVDRTTPTKIDAHFRPGNLGVNVDTAFASMEGPAALGGGDTFIVGGDLTDGGVFQCIAKSSPSCTQIIPNMSPVHDMLTINSHDHNGSKALRDPDRSERMFVCSGRGTEHAAVSEIRYGLEAQIGLTAEYNDLSSVSQVWTLSDHWNDRLVFLISHAQHTTAMSFYVNSLELEVDDSEGWPGIDLNTPTLAAAAILNGLIIQVTQTAVNITSFSPDTSVISKPYDSRIVAAAISRKLGMFTTATESSTGFEIRLFQVISGDSCVEIIPVGPMVYISQAPTAVLFADTDSTQFLLVGTVSGLLLLMFLDPATGLKIVGEHSLTDILKRPETCAISSLAVLNCAGGGEYGLLCGLRTGSLVCLTMEVRSKPMSQPGKPPEHSYHLTIPIISASSLTVHLLGLTLTREYLLGRTSVSVIQDAADNGAALVFCAKELRRLKILDDLSPLDISISPIYLTSRENPSYQQPSVNSLLRLDGSSFTQEMGLSGSLLCVTDNQILISSFILANQAIPRRLKTKGNPQQLAYSRHLNKIIVALDEVTFDGGGTLEHPLMKRKIRSALQFVDPDQRVLSSNSELHVHAVGETDERVTSIINWTPSDGKKHYEMIVIGLEVDSPDTKHTSGRLLCLTAKQAGSSAFLDVKPKYVKKFPGQPIHSLLAYDISSLLVCAGNDLVMIQLDVGARVWSQVAKFVLPSPAVALTTRGPFIYAATMHHSMEILEWKKGTLSMHSSDLQARNANSIIACDNGAAIVSFTSTDVKGGKITGFSAHPVNHESKIIFHVNLPLTVNNLKAGFTLPLDGSSHQCIYASTLDGTMYYLTTLNHHEWRLLHFLESMINHGRLGIARRRRRRRKGSVEPPTPTPEDMHIDGGVLAQVLGYGTHGLRHLLDQEINTENTAGDMPESVEDRQKYFRTLAQEVIGESEDPVGSVARWLRALMQN